MKRFIIRQLIRLGILNDVMYIDLETTLLHPHKRGSLMTVRYEYFPEKNYSKVIED